SDRVSLRRLQGRLQAQPALAVHLLRLRFRAGPRSYEAGHRRDEAASRRAEELPRATQADGISPEDQLQEPIERSPVARRNPELDADGQLQRVDERAPEEQDDAPIHNRLGEPVLDESQ